MNLRLRLRTEWDRTGGGSVGGQTKGVGTIEDSK